MPTQTVNVGSAVGLHARPAALIAEAASELDHEVTLTVPGGEPVDASSALLIMTLGAGKGDPGDEAGRSTQTRHQAPPVNMRVEVRSSPDLTTLSSGSGRAASGCSPGGVWVPGFCQFRICSGSAVGVTGGMTVP